VTAPGQLARASSGVTHLFELRSAPARDLASRAGAVAAIFAHQLRYLAGPADIALEISADGDSGSVLAGLETARSLGLLDPGVVT
jgi:hypothetical protein